MADVRFHACTKKELNGFRGYVEKLVDGEVVLVTSSQGGFSTRSKARHYAEDMREGARASYLISERMAPSTNLDTLRVVASDMLNALQRLDAVHNMPTNAVGYRIADRRAREAAAAAIVKAKTALAVSETRQVWLVEAEHPHVPGTHQRLYSTHAAAVDMAVAHCIQIRGACGLHTMQTNRQTWEAVADAIDEATQGSAYVRIVQLEFDAES